MNPVFYFFLNGLNKFFLGLFFLGFLTPGFSGVYQIKLLNDFQPDFHDNPSYLASVHQGWSTWEEKAKATWKWINLGHNQQRGTDNEFGLSNIDLINLMNNQSYTTCGMINGSMGASWEGTGNQAFYNALQGHVTTQFYYDGAYHMFDASYSNYIYNKNGSVASRTELADPVLWSKYNPFATAEKGDLSTPGDKRPIATYSGGSVGYENMPQLYAASLLNKQTFASAIDQVSLSVRPYEYYKRYKDPLPGALYIVSDYPPNSQHKNGSAYSNGEWVFEPDFSKTDWAETAFESVNIAMGGSPRIHPKTAGQASSVTFLVNTFNSIVKSDITASGSGQIQISYDMGKNWSFLGTLGASFSKTLQAELNAKKTFMLKFNFSSASDGLNSLKIKTVTQLNRKTFFQLNRGKNKVFVNLGPQLERIEFRPDITKATTWESFIHSKFNFYNSGSSYKHIMPQNSGTGWVAYEIKAPGDIKRIMMSGHFWRREVSEPISMEYSTNNGASWNMLHSVRLGTGKIASESGPTPVDKWMYDGDGFAETSISENGVKSVLFRVRIERTIGQNGILGKLTMAADYAPVGSPFKPLEVTMNWTEYRSTGKVTRTHKKTINTLAEWNTYEINVAGYRQPSMNYLTVNLAGHGPDGAAEGYSDADVNAAKVKLYWYNKKNRLSTGKSFTSSPSGSGSLSNLTDEIAEFANNNVGGSLVSYNGGDNPTLTLDLGSSQTVQGVTMLMAAPNSGYEFPDSVQVFAGATQGNLTYQGTIIKSDLWDWPGDYMPNQFWDHLSEQSLYGVNLDGYNFPLSFGNAVSARYVQFKVKNPDGKFLIWEIRAWGTMEKKDWKGDNFDHANLGPVSIYDRGPRIKTISGLSPVNVRLFPNPFGNTLTIHSQDFQPGSRGIQAFRVYDVRGNLIFGSRSKSPNGFSGPIVRWDGVNQAGKKLANGHYLIKINTDRGKTVQRVQILR